MGGCSGTRTEWSRMAFAGSGAGGALQLRRLQAPSSRGRPVTRKYYSCQCRTDLIWSLKQQPNELYQLTAVWCTPLIAALPVQPPLPVRRQMPGLGAREEPGGGLAATLFYTGVSTSVAFSSLLRWGLGLVLCFS